ncbi:TniQ family protein [Pseudofrankia sp. BMG5.36]|uniref:TniQ family protein n=1 Tax=Pseudofrankia sp. BMG5.36 TaxID=1834512 RepID=UPI0008DB12F3|nr:TniQ family protein [Pseudofrankia sp. BMG5.36]OHV44401.1 hypothetical protein BCD48_02360 [Pseudofrankia sp. BMG5.36]
MPARTLPLRLDPLPDEALGSWLETYAHRLQATLGDLAIALGLPTTDREHPSRMLAHAPDWTVSLHTSEAASIAAACGISPAALHSLTLTRFDGRAVHVDTERRRVRYRLWARTEGSRFCPSCLHESDGRWPLNWRLSWSFACPIHQCLLVDTCPRCDRPARTAGVALGFVPHPGHCARSIGGARGREAARCGADLTAAPALALSFARACDGPAT